MKIMRINTILLGSSIMVTMFLLLQCGGPPQTIACANDQECGNGNICVDNICVPGERFDGGPEDGGPEDGGIADGGAGDGGIADGGAGDGGPADGGSCVEPKEFMCPCGDHDECRSGVCIQTMGYGSICTKNCSDCPPGPPHWGCRGVVGAGGLIRSVCFPYGELYCIPCQGHPECGNINDRCVDVSGHNFCAQDCSGTMLCPSGYTCTEYGEDGKQIGLRDGGMGEDGGAAADGGGFADGGAAGDGGVFADGGAAEDGGVFTDGGAAEDGGTPPAVDGGRQDGGTTWKLCVPVGGLCPGCFDGDNDHYGVGADCLGRDCDDTRDFIYEGAPELCDGFDNNCDGRTDEGFDFNNDPVNCGLCGNKCKNDHGSTSCVEGNCAPLCEQGWGNCDSNANNGCESPLAMVSYCGSCSEDNQCPNGFFCNGVLCEKKHADGDPCSRAVECVSAYCIDNVCCNEPCTELCRACNLPTRRGLCSFHNQGEDPENDCEDQGNATCGQNGKCDGAGACAYYAVDSICENPSCDPIRNEQTAERLCTARMQCADKVITPCSPYRCGTTACKTACTNHQDCMHGYICLNPPLCEAGAGQPCNTAENCGSHECWDNVCCDRKCDGPCRICDAAGICRDHPVNNDPEDGCGSYQCNGTGACFTACTSQENCKTSTHYCDGQHCQRKKPNGNVCEYAQECLSGFCTDGICCQSQCSGPCVGCQAPDGNCTSRPENTDPENGCGLYQCGGSGLCRTDCTVQEHCKPDGGYCEGGQCLPKKLKGQGCANNHECASGHCVDGVCCESKCDGTCRACNAVGSQGDCTSVLNAEDQGTCTGMYICDSIGSCKLKNGQGCANGSECASTFCKDGVCCNSTCAEPCKTCNAVANPGVCGAVTSGDDNPECTGENSCDNAGSCKKKNGQSCSNSNECVSGHCKDGACCDLQCQIPCYNCSTGACSPVANDDDLPECTGNNTCSATSECRLKNGQSCTLNDDCASTYCKTDHDGTGMWCAGQNGCVHDGALYPSDSFSVSCHDERNRTKCVNGVWTAQGCGADSCQGTCGSTMNGCMHHLKGCNQGDGTCFDDARDADQAESYCSSCQLSWNIGGEVAAQTCCGDDENEHVRICEDYSANGDCGRDRTACCGKATDCVDHQGDCTDEGSCPVFGEGGKRSYCAAGKWEDPDQSQAFCDGCGYSWSIGGETAAQACCGDDADEYVRTCEDSTTNGDCGADSSACCDAQQDCVDHSGNCVDTGSCAIFGLGGKRSYCDGGVWKDPDESAAFCTASSCGYTWLAGPAQCCGDDPGEDLEWAGPGRSCCYNGSELRHQESQGAVLCFNGQLYDCNGAVNDDSGLSDHRSTCDEVGGKYCTAGNSWAAGIPVGCACNQNGACLSGFCLMDYDGTGSWCGAQTECAHNRVLYQSGTYSADCYDDGGKAFCNQGTWEKESCGINECQGTCGSGTNGCNYIIRACNGGFCVDSAKDPDAEQGYCTNCGQVWNIGGETAQGGCCGDDANERVRTCNDNSANGDCGTDIKACCEADTDCVDHEGNCADQGACYVFGALGQKSYCANGAWNDPDSASAYCLAAGCEYSWLASAGLCCGDDPGEDLEQTGQGNPCCYNGKILAHGTAQDSVLCHDGLLYDCNGVAADDSGLSEHKNPCEQVGSLYCTNENKWSLTLSAGCACTENAACQSGQCKIDYDGQGSWCAGPTQCAHNSVLYESGAYSVDCHDDSNKARCSSGTWSTESCGDNRPCTAYSCVAGDCKTTHHDHQKLCNSAFQCAEEAGDNKYGTAGDLKCQGYCDSAGNCDYADSCYNCNTEDGWYNTGDEGPGCGNLNDPVAQNRNYTCSLGNCTFAVTESRDCNSQDGYYGGGKSPDCGADPESQQKDYYADSTGQCVATTEGCSRVSCDLQDICRPVCDGDTLRAYKDYYVQENSASCTHEYGPLVENCLTKPSVDSDGSAQGYAVGGTVTDYIGCQNGSCQEVKYPDRCEGQSLVEYGAQGAGYVENRHDCLSNETLYCKDNDLYRDAWRCTGSPGYCSNEEPDRLEQDCGVDGCGGNCGSAEGCAYHLRSCGATPARCLDEARDPDSNQNYCTGCGQAWSIGGEVAPDSCCGDDAGEYGLNCNDNSANGDCGTDKKACCEANTDCVDHLGNCADSGACYVFGTGGRMSYCDNGAWTDPDGASAYCLASGCGFAWLATAGLCCGDDPGEDLEQAGSNNSCCYNGAQLSSGSSLGPVLCHDGLLYDCNGTAGDDSDLAEHKGTCDQVGSNYCNNSNLWASAKPAGCSCTGNGDCQSGYCKTDYDGAGKWCAGQTQCVHDNVLYESGTYSVGCFDDGNKAKCSSGNWVKESCGTNTKCTVYSCLSGDCQTTHHDQQRICNSAYQCAEEAGDNKYGTAGDLRCQGYCDGAGNCDLAGNCQDCNIQDGWYNTGDEGPGCAELNDPEAERRNYTCSLGQCSYSVTGRENCNTRDGYTGGGDNSGCGADPSVQQVDYYANSSGQCISTTMNCNTVNCDGQDICSQICAGDSVRAYKDYYAEQSTGTCTYAYGPELDNCATKLSADTDGSATAYAVGGTVTDYIDCQNGACRAVSHSDRCNGSILVEYGAQGAGYVENTHDCQNFETLYCKNSDVYRDKWTCSGSPGYCNNSAVDIVEEDCGNSGCEGSCGSGTNGCMYHQKSCESSPAHCVDQAVDPDSGQSYCNLCSLAWSIGGEVAQGSCCGDDSGEHIRTCVDESDNGDCAIDLRACCSSRTDCVDHEDNCVDSSICAVFGTGGKKSYCDQGTWRDPDGASEYCTASGCSFTWFAAVNLCCGDDPGEDFEQPGSGRSCCYNGSALASGATQGPILCHDGQLHDCNGTTTDDSDLAEHQPTCGQVGPRFCNADKTWTTTKPAGCGCAGDSECQSGYCKADYDGTGKWCAGPSQCAHNALLYGSGSYSADCYDNGSKARCDNGNWASESCGANTDCTDYSCQSGDCLTQHHDSSRLCNSLFRCSSTEGDNGYSTGGDFRCQGFCDGAGNCDFGGNCTDCNKDDGWYNTGDLGPGCSDMSDPLGEQRDYTCSLNNCTYTIATTQNCNSQDGYYGGGDNSGCGQDPDSQQIDYYVNSLGQCVSTTQNCATVSCDSQDTCTNVCDGDTIRAYKDYYVVENTGNCSYTFGSFIENCAVKPSTDSDGSSTAYTIGGTVIDITGCANGACTTAIHSDTCDGHFITEYGAQGAGYISTTYNCENFETKYCLNNNVYRDNWTCTGSPGYCSNIAQDTEEENCGTDGCEGTCGNGTNGCMYHLKSCASNPARCVDDARDPDTSQSYCTGCTLSWNIGGETAQSTCCGDDASEYVRTCNDDSANGNCGTDVKACCEANSDCVDHLGNCADTGACYIFGADAKFSYCDSNGIWQDPDEASEFCLASGCGFSWLSASASCCGDDPGEDFEQPGSGLSCCYNASALASNISQNSVLCYDGLLYDCNAQAGDDSGLAEHKNTCEKVGNLFCTSNYTWSTAMSAGCACTGDGDCQSGYCKADYDGNGKWCANQSQCVHNGQIYETSQHSIDCYDAARLALCQNGSWVIESCGANSCDGSCGSGLNGCQYHLRSCAPNPAHCVDDAYNPDNSQTYCTGCGLSWNIGGEVAQNSCCGDDAGEYANACNDNSENGGCGTDTMACCNGYTDCVDHDGNCISTGTCNIFGTEGKLSYCDNGIWRGPDEAQNYCGGCGFSWNIGGEIAPTSCCGDDSGEHIRLCNDDLANGYCGADRLACCNSAIDCVDHNGNCTNSGACYIFGSGNKKSYCDSGGWTDPDRASQYCTAAGCGYAWMATANQCCGDDPGEDFEQAGSGNSCCYNGSALASGAAQGSVLCHDGQLYDCNGEAIDDSGLAEHKATCAKVGNAYCTSANTWSAGMSGGCTCLDNSDCQSGYCKADYDGNGKWCAGQYQCAHDGQIYESSAYSVDCLDDGAKARCNSGNWIAESCGTDTACTNYSCSSGQCHTQHHGTDKLCNEAFQCASGTGDNRYGQAGDLKCQGYCDNGGNCDFAGNCFNCNDDDGWYDTGDLGPGCLNMSDPVAIRRDYTCSLGNCTYTVADTQDCNGQDGYSGGGNSSGCGTDPSSQQKDYYANISGQCLSSTANCTSVNCDHLDICAYICDGDTIKSYKDYYVAQNTDTCTYLYGAAVDNCATKLSVDSDGSSAAYTVGGTVTDYTGCSSGACVSTLLSDNCSGTWLVEYGAQGAGYTQTSYDCQNYETLYCSGSKLYRNKWTCSGSPGYCNDGAADILEQDCGTNGCEGSCGSGTNGCLYHIKTCDPSPARCVDTSLDPDTGPTYCNGCNLLWSIGGEVAPIACCGDDAGEYVRSCNDDSDNGDCGTDLNACCQANTDCVDHNGNCANTGACYIFGAGGKRSYCDSGNWTDPDSASTYCTASGCGFAWLGTANLCCGDDAGEDIEQSGNNNSCCYNGALLPSGTALGSILCHHGLLYDCNGISVDDSNLAEHKVICDQVGTLFCTGANTWNSGMPAGCSCTDEDCQTGFCKLDYDGTGNWCAGQTQCVHNGIIYESGAYSSDCYNNGNLAKCSGGNWVAESCGSDTACTDYSCASGSCHTTHHDSNTLCDAAYQCSSGSGNNGYGTAGDYRCQGFCDNEGNCDYADNCINCNDNDGWHNTGDLGPGCNNLTDPIAENRDYTCSLGNCTHTVLSSQNCNLQDGYYGGGNTSGCGADASSQQKDYYANNQGQCISSVAYCNTVNCDSQDICSHICDGDTVRSYKDYHVVENSANCTYEFGPQLENCATKLTVDTDGSAQAYKTGGTVTDYTGCANGACTETTYSDYCQGTVVYEYGASGSGVVGPAGYDCQNYETTYCLANEVYRNEWTCSGTPGYCNDSAPDTMVENCGVNGCTGLCGSGPNGCTYVLRGCDSGQCQSDARDLDSQQSYCTGCGLSWNIGGDVAQTSCCGDDAGEFIRTCIDDSANGDCGADNKSCCQHISDCIDHNGACALSASCHPFGTGGKRSYCDSGTWQDPDEASTYCTGSGCGFNWLSGAEKCCGDDAGEDHEQSGSGNSCCYNGSILPSGASQNSILCLNGLLYDCNGMAEDDSGLAEHKTSCDKVGLFYCSLNNTWSNKLSNGCTCNTGSDCLSAHCVDGICCNEGCTSECKQCTTGTCQNLPDGTGCGAGQYCSSHILYPGDYCSGGTCQDPSGTACPGDFMCLDGTSCRTSCTADTHCNNTQCTIENLCCSEQVPIKSFGANCGEGALFELHDTYTRSEVLTANLIDQQAHWYRFKAVEDQHGIYDCSDSIYNFGLSIGFDNNPNDAYRFEIKMGSKTDNSCTSAIDVCPNPGDTKYSHVTPCPCDSGVPYGSAPTHCDDDSKHFFVRVFRKSGGTASCAGYSLKILVGKCDATSVCPGNMTCNASGRCE